MVNTVAIIPAAGTGERWGNHLGTAKHLAPIDSGRSTILHRNIDMLYGLGVAQAHVITRCPRIAAAVGDRANLIEPACATYLSDTLLASAQVWARRTVVLLGDVYASEALLAAMLGHDRPVRFFGIEPGSPPHRRGRRPEVYGMSFDRSQHERLRRGLAAESTLARQRDRGTGLGRAMRHRHVALRDSLGRHHPPKPPGLLRRFGVGPGSAWRIYRAMALRRPRHVWRIGKLWGLYLRLADVDPFTGPQFNRWQGDPSCFQTIDDLTRDIDDPADYRDLLARLGEYRS